jgi:cytochrome c553
MKLTEWFKFCQSCGNKQYYSAKYELIRATKNNTVCISCHNKSGKNNKLQMIGKGNLRHNKQKEIKLNQLDADLRPDVILRSRVASGWQGSSEWAFG